MKALFSDVSSRSRFKISDLCCSVRTNYTSAVRRYAIADRGATREIEPAKQMPHLLIIVHHHGCWKRLQDMEQSQEGDSDVPSTLYDLVQRATTDEDWAQLASLATSTFRDLARYQSPKSERSRTPLHAAVAKHAPVAAIAAIVSAYPQACLIADAEGLVPLHVVALSSDSASGADPASVAQLLLEREPNAAVTLDWYGNTPLHLAALMGARLSIVQEICRVEQAREASLMQNHRGNCPIHDAVDFHLPLPILRVILDVTRPEAMLKKNKERMSPLALACSRSSNLDDSTIRLILVYLCQHGIVQECLQQRHLEGSCRPQSMGLTPFGFLCFSARERINEAIQELSQDGSLRQGHTFQRIWSVSEMILNASFNDGTGIDRIDAKGRSKSMVNACLRPELGVSSEMQRLIVLRCRNQLVLVDENENMPLHRACARALPRSYTEGGPIEYLLEGNMEVAKIPNGQGKLPIVILEENECCSWKGGIRSLLFAYPKGLFELDGMVAPIYPHVFSLIMKEDKEKIDYGFRDPISRRTCFDIVFELLRDSPEIIGGDIT